MGLKFELRTLDFGLAETERRGWVGEFRPFLLFEIEKESRF
jgi:hypothetical protein